MGGHPEDRRAIESSKYWYLVRAWRMHVDEESETVTKMLSYGKCSRGACTHLDIDFTVFSKTDQTQAARWRQQLSPRNSSGLKRGSMGLCVGLFSYWQYEAA